jgi:hypothetical protein
MKINRKNVRLFLVMSLFATVLVACNAAVSSEPAGPDQGSVLADPDLVDDTAQKTEAGASSEEIASSPIVEQTEEAPVGEDVTTEDPLSVTAGDESTSETSGNGPADSPEGNDGEANTEDDEDSPESGDQTTPENTDDAASAGLDEDGIMTIDDRSERQREISQEWNTDFNRHTIPYEELLALLPVRDGIIPIDLPTFETLEEASAWLAENEPVIALEIDGDARAYPLQILTWHEIVNDSVGDIPVVVTFCPLCNSALVFDRRLDGEVYDFGTSGWLRHSDLVMWDRNTESLWQQFTGEGIVGELAGEQLEFLPSSIISFADFNAAFPDGVVLSRNTGFGRPYGQNPYPGYDRIGQDPFAFIGVPDRRLAAMERVVTVSLDGLDLAYPLLELLDAGVINDTQGGQDLVVFHVGGTASALDNAVIFRSEDVGATGVFDPNLNGQKLTFIKDGDVIMDEQSGSTWNIVGQAIDGPLAGEQLTPIVHADHFWFSWAAFRPDTIIYGS